MHIGDFVTSTNRTGSQKPIGIPGIGIGIPDLVHAHNGIGGRGNLGGAVSGSPLTILTPRTVMGNKQLQHTSVIGLTNRPVQPTLAVAAWLVSIRIIINNEHLMLRKSYEQFIV
jgi:hypothetical protein